MFQKVSTFQQQVSIIKDCIVLDLSVQTDNSKTIQSLMMLPPVWAADQTGGHLQHWLCVYCVCVVDPEETWSHLCCTTFVGTTNDNKALIAWLIDYKEQTTHLPFAPPNTTPLRTPPPPPPLHHPPHQTPPPPPSLPLPPHQYQYHF